MDRFTVSEVPEEYIGTFPDMIATYLDRLPDVDDPILISLMAVLLASILVTRLVVVRFQRHAGSVAAEPLLGAA